MSLPPHPTHPPVRRTRHRPRSDRLVLPTDSSVPSAIHVPPSTLPKYRRRLSTYTSIQHKISSIEPQRAERVSHVWTPYCSPASSTTLLRNRHFRPWSWTQVISPARSHERSILSVSARQQVRRPPTIARCSSPAKHTPWCSPAKHRPSPWSSPTSYGGVTPP